MKASLFSTLDGNLEFTKFHQNSYQKQTQCNKLIINVHGTLLQIVVLCVTTVLSDFTDDFVLQLRHGTSPKDLAHQLDLGPVSLSREQ